MKLSIVEKLCKAEKKIVAKTGLFLSGIVSPDDTLISTAMAEMLTGLSTAMWSAVHSLEADAG